jgi:hypothetical protein
VVIVHEYIWPILVILNIWKYQILIKHPFML